MSNAGQDQRGVSRGEASPSQISLPNCSSHEASPWLPAPHPLQLHCSMPCAPNVELSYICPTHGQARARERVGRVDAHVDPCHRAVRAGGRTDRQARRATVGVALVDVRPIACGSDADRGGQEEAGREGLAHHHPGRGCVPSRCSTLDKESPLSAKVAKN